MNEQIKDDLERRVRSLEALVRSLCITNFMTEHEDGDEDARNDAVRIINHQARQAKERYKVFDRHHELFISCREKTEEMLVLEQDYPELKNRYKGVL